MADEPDDPLKFTTDALGNRILRGLTLSETAEILAYEEGAPTSYKNLDEEEAAEARITLLMEKHAEAQKEAFAEGLRWRDTLGPKRRGGRVNSLLFRPGTPRGPKR